MTNTSVSPRSFARPSLSSVAREIVPGFAGDQVAAAGAVELIVAVAAPNDIAARAADDDVVARSAHERHRRADVDENASRQTHP